MSTEKFLPQTDTGLLSFRAGPCQKKLETFSGTLSALVSKGRERRRLLSVGNGLQAGHGKISPAHLGEVIQICVHTRSFGVIRVGCFFGKEWDYNCGSE